MGILYKKWDEGKYRVLQARTWMQYGGGGFVLFIYVYFNVLKVRGIGAWIMLGIFALLILLVTIDGREAWFIALRKKKFIKSGRAYSFSDPITFKIEK